MAAATGYGDALTDEQLLAYNDLLRDGRDLAEVFAVRVPAAAGWNRPPPRGVISMHGFHSSGCIYGARRLGPDDATPPQICDSQGNLMLTGPSEAISADGPISFILDLYDGNQERSLQEKENNSTTISYNTCSGEMTILDYNRTIVETVNTGYGPVDVICAVLTNGVEGQISVKLARCDGEGPSAIFGRIVARSKLFDAGCVLFYNENDKKMHVGSEETIPLARHAIAVPLCVPLVIELDLQSYSGDEIVRGALEFNPASEGQHMKRIIGMNGAEIEVSISYSFYLW